MVWKGRIWNASGRGKREPDTSWEHGCTSVAVCYAQTPRHPGLDGQLELTRPPTLSEKPLCLTQKRNIYESIKCVPGDMGPYVSDLPTVAKGGICTATVWLADEGKVPIALPPAIKYEGPVRSLTAVERRLKTASQRQSSWPLQGD